MKLLQFNTVYIFDVDVPRTRFEGKTPTSTKDKVFLVAEPRGPRPTEWEKMRKVAGIGGANGTDQFGIMLISQSALVDGPEEREAKRIAVERGSKWDGGWGN